MKKLLKKVLLDKKRKVPINDPIQILISRLCDPKDPIYDETFANGMHGFAENPWRGSHTNALRPWKHALAHLVV